MKLSTVLTKGAIKLIKLILTIICWFGPTLIVMYTWDEYSSANPMPEWRLIFASIFALIGFVRVWKLLEPPKKLQELPVIDLNAPKAPERLQDGTDNRS